MYWPSYNTQCRIDAQFAPFDLLRRCADIRTYISYNQGIGNGEYERVTITDTIKLCGQGIAATPTPSATPTPTPTPAPTPTYSITKTVSLPVNSTGNADAFEIAPSLLACGKAVTTLQQANFNFQCMQQVDGQTQPAEGCSLRYDFSPGAEDGGHTHSYSNEEQRFGRIVQFGASQTTVIPSGGLNMTYVAPEVSGDIELRLIALDPNGRLINNLSDSTIKVRQLESTLVDLRNSGVDFVIQSHPGNGYYGTSSVMKELSSILSEFRADALAAHGSNYRLPRLESQAGSLRLGGLFDINRDWRAPHCGHRKGLEVYLSMSVLNNDPNAVSLKRILQKVIRGSGFTFPVNVESPSNPSASHWHLRGEQ